MVEGEEDWKTYALINQIDYFDIFGSRRYDEIPKSDLFLLKKKVGFATFGTPKELPKLNNYNTGYSKEQIEHIRPICDKIIEKSDFDPIRFACTILILRHKECVSETTVFRIILSTGNIFIDTHARVYEKWEQYMTNNMLPDCEYCYPLNGEYTDTDDMKIEFAHSPASSAISKAIDYADTAGTVASVGAAAVFATSLAVVVAPAALAVAGTAAACTAAYSATRSITSLVDRKKHEQSIGLDNSESRAAWLNLGTSAICAGTGAALSKAKDIAKSGKSLGNAAKYGLHVLTASSVVFSGYGFVETLRSCVDKYQKGVLTNKDVFDLSCELLFLFNALASAKATTNLVNSMSAVSEGPSIQKKLTRTQKRNLRKRAAKQRAKGLSPTVSNENSNYTSETMCSTNLQRMLLNAATVFVPRVQEILYICQNIGHDIMCWKNNEIPLTKLLPNITRNLVQLYDMFKNDINEALSKVMQYFESLPVGKYKDKFIQWFFSGTEEIQSYFFSKVKNMEEELDTMLSEADKDITDLHEELEIEVCDDSNYGNEDSSIVDNLSPEAQILLSKCEDLCFISETFCNNLEDFGDVVDEAKHSIFNEFKGKISNYKMSLEAAKSASGETFDVKIFHNKLGIVGDITEHFFSETVKSLSADSSIYKIKKKLNQAKRERNLTTTRVWKSVINNIYNFYGTHGAGLLKKEILSIVGDIVCKDLKDGSCKWVDDSGIVLIETSDDNTDGEANCNMQVVVSYEVNQENTVFGFIILLE